MISDLLIKVARNEPLSPVEMTEFERYVKDVDKSGDFVNKWVGVNKDVRFDKLSAGVIDCDVPITRGVNFSSASAPTAGNGVYTGISFPNSRGYIKQQDACVQLLSGYTDRIIRNPILPSNTTFCISAQATFGVGGLTTAAYILAIDYYVDGIYDSSFTCATNYDPAFYTDETTNVIVLENILDNEQVRVSVYQDTGAPLAMVGYVELNFFMV